MFILLLFLSLNLFVKCDQINFNHEKNEEVEFSNENQLEKVLNIYVNKLSTKEKEVTLEKGKLLIKILNIISDIFKTKKITYKQKSNLQNTLAQIKSLNSKYNKKVDKQQLEVEQDLIHAFFKKLQDEAELDIVKVLIDLATINQKQIELTFTPKKLTNLLTLILELVVPLIDLNPIIEKAINLTNEITTKFEIDTSANSTPITI